MTPIVKTFGEVVARVSEKLTPVLTARDEFIKAVHYQHGHQAEIVATLKEMDQTRQYQSQKFPLVWLQQDFSEQQGTGIGYATAWRPASVFIFANSVENMKAAKRYDNYFEPVLYPIYTELLRQLHAHPLFSTQSANTIRHTKIDHPFFGKEGLYGSTENKLNRPLDCIELRNLELTVRNETCNYTTFKSF